MKHEFDPDRLDVAAFAGAQAALSATDPVSAFRRLSDELNAPADDAVVRWQAAGQERTGGQGGAPIPWLHLDARAGVTLVCQRCLGPVAVELHVDRWFRFVPDEERAAAEDEEAEEDVLALNRQFDLRSLVEDELLMELPLAPRHPVCPQPVRLSAADDDFERADVARTHPFAVLGELVPRKPS